MLLLFLCQFLKIIIEMVDLKMTMTRIIYRSQNIENNKVYIGMSKHLDLEPRKKQHLYKCKDQTNEFYKDLFSNPELFVWEIIEELQTYEEAVVAERKWIQFYKECEKSYNNSWGQGTYKIVYSKESREKIAATKRGELCYKAKLSNDDVEEIRKLLKFSQLPQYKIAEKFSVSPATISLINTGDTWKNISV